MTTLEQWRELEALLANATGRNSEIDCICYVIAHIPLERAGRIDVRGGYVGWWPNDAPYEGAVRPPFYSYSIDAALAFAEKVGGGVDHFVRDCLNRAITMWTDSHITECSARNEWLSQDYRKLPRFILRAVCAAKITELENDAAM